MNGRGRFVNTVLGKPTDRGVLWPEAFWTETLPKWREEGMPGEYDFRFDFTRRDFHFGLGVNLGYCPPFEEEVLVDEQSTQVVRDEYGIVKRIKKYESGMPEFLEYPLADRASWEKLKPRLAPEDGRRFPEDWSQRAEELKDADFPVSLILGHHLSGFFSFLRELAGERCYYLFYDDPDLVREILSFQEYRLSNLLRTISRDVHIDHQFIWEDMCYKNGPLISPQLFRDFLLGPYTRTIEVARECGVEVIQVDSDGDVSKLIPLWLEAGVNLNQPLEVAAGNDVVELKRTYGDRLAFLGGIDKRALAAGPAEIDRELARVQPAFEMGGYIPSIDHAVPSNVSWQHYCYYREKLVEMVGA